MAAQISIQCISLPPIRLLSKFVSLGSTISFITVRLSLGVLTSIAKDFLTAKLALNYPLNGNFMPKLYSFAPYLESMEQEKGACLVVIKNNHFYLLAERAIYWQERSTLLIADVHLGKVNHFRKAGIPVPSAVISQDMDRLSRIVDQTLASNVIFLGDLFHSNLNKEWAIFTDWRKYYSSVDIELIRGNHDIISAARYKESGIKVYPVAKQEDGFLFTHDFIPAPENGLFNFSGHIHPCIRIQGRARQTEALPCFYFDVNNALLPSFGSFTGCKVIEPSRDSKSYVIAGDKVICWTPSKR
jgi:DNA ligase-associated metallophosphoesterase